jgi:hypothetical protein
LSPQAQGELLITTPPGSDADTDAARDADAQAHGTRMTAATHRAAHVCAASQAATAIGPYDATANHAAHDAAAAANSAPPTDADGL